MTLGSLIVFGWNNWAWFFPTSQPLDPLRFTWKTRASWARVNPEEGVIRHVPRPPPNTEFNSVLKYGLKMRLAPKFTPIYLILGVLREFSAFASCVILDLIHPNDPIKAASIN